MTMGCRLAISFAFSVLLLRPIVLCRRVIEPTVLAVGQSEENSTQNLRFHIRNDASFPLNLLVLPKTYTVWAGAKNHMSPGDVYAFVPAMGAYDFYAVVDDGTKEFAQNSEAAWGLTKAGVAYFLEIAAGAGTSGTLAVTAASLATTAAAAYFASPVIITVVGLSAFWGTAVCSAMAVSQITKDSMDYVAARTEDLARGTSRVDVHDKAFHLNSAGRNDKLNPVVAQIFAHQDSSSKFVFFDDVVTEETVRNAFTTKFDVKSTRNIVLTRRDAEAYFLALQVKFSNWALVRGSKERFFVITGGFSVPESIPNSAGYSKTSFSALACGESMPEAHLCNHRLVIDYKTYKGGEWKQEVLERNWEKVLIAEKVTGSIERGRFCVASYIVECQKGVMTKVKTCRRVSYNRPNAPADVTSAERWLGRYAARSVTLKSAEWGLRLLVNQSSAASLQEAASDKIIHRDHAIMEEDELQQISVWVEPPPKESED